MKSVVLAATALFSLSNFAQTTVVISTGAGNTQQVFHSLLNGEVSAPALADWDLAFETTGITGSILVNTAKGMQVYKAPYAINQWETLDTTGLAGNWAPQHNSEVDWSSGALNQGLTSDPFDLGWGIYNMVNHNIVGDSLFVLTMADGSWKKFKVDGYLASTNAFTFTWADLDGGNEQVGTMVRSDFTGMNFGYYSMTANATVAQEPPAADWDLLFTKYIGFVTQPEEAYYAVVGVLQNKEVPVEQVDGVPSASAQWTPSAMENDINVIGYDWKNFNMGTFMWEYAQDRTYFVQDRALNIWKLVFTQYGGGANGEITFTQELVSPTSVEEVEQNGTTAIYPNPSSTGVVTMMINVPATDAQLTVTDLNGKLVRVERLVGITPMQTRVLDISGIASGFYNVSIAHSNGVAHTKLIVQ